MTNNKEKINKQIHAQELKLRILMTNSCNQNCPNCLNDFQKKPKKGQEQFLKIETAKIAIKEYANYFKGKYPLQIYFSGGEPTLHPDLINLMKYAKSFGSRVTLNTNGNFPNSLELNLMSFSDIIHFGTYEINEEHAKKVKRMKGFIQGIYPQFDESFIKFYSSYNLPIKIFKDFYDNSNNYIKFVEEITKKFPNVDLSFRHTGIQENRGLGCGECEKKCITLKATWIFPNGNTSPCPQLYKHPATYPKNSQEWCEYFKVVEKFHKKE